MRRDWTPTDQADAADDERERQWWKKPNPYLDPEYRGGPSDDEADAEGPHD